MTGAELRDAVDAVVGQVPFESPVTAMYCTRVRDLLRGDYLEKLQEQSYSMEVYHRHNELVVSIWLVPVDREHKIRGQWVKHQYTYPLP